MEGEEMTLEIKLRVVTSIGEMADLKPGDRIATNHNKLLILEAAFGGIYWFEYGELTAYSPIVEWFPVIVLPPVVSLEEAAEAERVKVTAEEIEAARSPSGGFTKAQLAKWGVPWPPPRGWKERLVNNQNKPNAT